MSELDLLVDSGEECGMALDAEPLAAVSFEEEAEVVLARLRVAFGGALAEMGVRRASDLQKLLQVDHKLSWQMFRVAAEGNVMTAGSFVPSRVSLEKVASMGAKKGLSKGQSAAVMEAYEDFEKLVERHAGDPASFNSLITAVTGATEEALAADMQHRRHAFRSFSHFTGSQAKTNFTLGVHLRAVNKKAMSAQAKGWIGLRTMRPMKKVLVMGRRVLADGPGLDFSREPIGLSSEAGGYLIPEFCSRPLPRLDLLTGKREWGQFTELSLVEPQVGNLGVKDLVFGDVMRGVEVTARFMYVTGTPSEVMLADVMLEPGALAGKPGARVFLGDENPPERGPDAIPMEGDFSVEMLGRGPEVLATADVPGYPEIARTLGRRLGADLEKFEVWRFRQEFPVYKSTAMIEWGK